MSRSFTDYEKDNIRKSLLEACKQSWTQYGYKKTSVDELCKHAGISKGAFYLFFESKEALFCEVLCTVQEQICDTASEIMEKQKDKNQRRNDMKRIMAALLALSAPSQQLHDDHQHPHRGGDAGEDQAQGNQPVDQVAVFAL